MGSFRVELQAVGGHGCQREIKIPEGQTEVEIPKCNNRLCPDCRAIEMLENYLSNTGTSFEEAKLVHWPQQEDGGIVEELRVSGTYGNIRLQRFRKRNF